MQIHPLVSYHNPCRNGQATDPGDADMCRATQPPTSKPELLNCYYMNHTHGPFPRLPGWAGNRKLKPVWISLKQETVSGSGTSWAICKSEPRSRQKTMLAPPLSFLQAGCPSCRPTNSVKALKAKALGKLHESNTVKLLLTRIYHGICDDCDFYSASLHWNTTYNHQ